MENSIQAEGDSCPKLSREIYLPQRQIVTLHLAFPEKTYTDITLVYRRKETDVLPHFIVKVTGRHWEASTSDKACGELMDHVVALYDALTLRTAATRQLRGKFTTPFMKAELTTAVSEYWEEVQRAKVR